MSYFTIIGICNTPEQAETIADTLYGHIVTIVDWHHNHPFKSEKLKGKPSPAELEIAKQYNLKWEKCHDWLMVDIEDIQETVTVYDNWIFLTSGETNAPPQPFDALMRALGAQVAVDSDTQPLGITIEAKIAQPQKIADQITTYITQDGLAPCPWMVYIDGDKDPQADKWLALEPAYLELTRRFRDVDNHPDLIPFKGKPDYDAKMLAIMDNIFSEQSVLKFEDVAILDDMREACAIISNGDHSPDMPHHPATITIDGDTITLKHIAFAEIATGLPAFLSWLEAEGANDLRYELG